MVVQKSGWGKRVSPKAVSGQCTSQRLHAPVEHFLFADYTLIW
jgi:hypothetical protein